MRASCQKLDRPCRAWLCLGVLPGASPRAIIFRPFRPLRRDDFIDAEPMAAKLFSVILFRGLCRCERVFDGGEDFALDDERFAGDARAGGGFVAAAAELCGDFIHVHIIRF